MRVGEGYMLIHDFIDQYTKREFDRIQNEVAGAVYSAGGVMEQHVGRNLRSMERLSKQINAML